MDNVFGFAIWDDYLKAWDVRKHHRCLFELSYKWSVLGRSVRRWGSLWTREILNQGYPESGRTLNQWTPESVELWMNQRDPWIREPSRIKETLNQGAPESGKSWIKETLDQGTPDLLASTDKPLISWVATEDGSISFNKASVLPFSASSSLVRASSCSLLASSCRLNLDFF